MTPHQPSGLPQICFRAVFKLLELLDLSQLARDGVHEFLFMVAPLPITGGVGSPINPLAVC